MARASLARLAMRATAAAPWTSPSAACSERQPARAEPPRAYALLHLRRRLFLLRHRRHRRHLHPPRRLRSTSRAAMPAAATLTPRVPQRPLMETEEPTGIQPATHDTSMRGGSCSHRARPHLAHRHASHVAHTASACSPTLERVARMASEGAQDLTGGMSPYAAGTSHQLPSRSRLSPSHRCRPRGLRRTTRCIAVSRRPPPHAPR